MKLLRIPGGDERIKTISSSAGLGGGMPVIHLRTNGASALVLVVMATMSTACAGAPPTLDEIGRERFADLGEFRESLSCQPQFSVFVSTSEPITIESEAQAIELAESILIDSSREVDRVVPAGAFWLLVDSDGVVYAAMDSVGGSGVGCADS